MGDPEIAPRLLEHLRATLGTRALQFAEAPARVGGGFDTRIFTFRLAGGPAGFGGRLVLRLLGAHHDPARALRERATQNTLADLGYPAPRVLLATTDTAALGGAFLIMEHRPGKVLPAASVIGMSTVLVAMQTRLHALDPGPFVRALDAEVARFDGQLAQFERRIVRQALDGLGPALAWLREHRPPERGRVICHGDFHPLNILVDRGGVSAVIDWPNAIVAEPELDVAATATILGCTPVEVTGIPRALRWLVRVARPILLTRYLRGYRRHRDLDPTRLAYYEGAACLRALVRAGESRLSRAGAPGLPPPTSLDTPIFADALTRRFARISGIVPRLPPVETP